nr:AAA family ATPase [Allokutzneria sp. NRRL B-24872]
MCPACGARTDVPRVEGSPAVVVCADCDHRRGFHRLPLLCLTGPSGTGKSTVCRELAARLSEHVVVLEQDVLWVEGLRDPAEDHRAFRSTWLRMISMIQQNGRPVLLCGTVVPPEFEPLPERALFSDVHYLALMCDPEPLAERLRRRPAWRGWSEPRIVETLEYAQWLRDEGASLSPPVGLLDTTEVAVSETADAVCAWVEATLGLSLAEPAAS